LRGNCLLRQVIEGEIKEGIEVTGIWGRRRRKLLDDLNERRGYSNLKEVAPDRTMWRAGFGRGFGPVVRLLNEMKWMNCELDDDIEMDGKTKNKYKAPFWLKYRPFRRPFFISQHFR
jgi:hypothetical protein